MGGIESEIGTMKIINSPSQLKHEFRNLLLKFDNIYFSVAWAGSNFELSNDLFQSKHKVKKGVVGIHFFQTDPEFIKQCSTHSQFKFIMIPEGVFHPKVYLFTKDDGNWNALIGSANFTSGGFGKNEELVALVGSEDASTISTKDTIVEAISRYWNSPHAKFAKEINLETYEYWHKRSKYHLTKAEAKFMDRSTANSIFDIQICNMSWKAYFNNVKNDKNNSLLDRSKVLEEARNRFKHYHSFFEISNEDRKKIAGYVTTNQIKWKYFGSMQGAGRFKQVINSNSMRISLALDEIPLIGKVEKGNYMRYIEKYIDAFKQYDYKGHGIATATRLLTLKRPDYFICLDSQNKMGLTAAFGLKLKNHDYESYWESIIERILASPWWTCPRPADPIEQHVWDGRAAFLDSLYYEGRGD